MQKLSVIITGIAIRGLTSPARPESGEPRDVSLRILFSKSIVMPQNLPTGAYHTALSFFQQPASLLGFNSSGIRQNSVTDKKTGNSGEFHYSQSLSPTMRRAIAFFRVHRAARLRPRDTQNTRGGFSLIEVMIATAILMGSAIVLARLAGMGRDQSQKARLYSEAQQICEQTMHELLLGLRPMELVESMPLIPLPEPVQTTDDNMSEPDMFAAEETSAEQVIDETNPEWRHSVRMDLLPDQPGMWSLTVILVQGDQTLPRPIAFSLTRWISGPPPEGAFDDLSRGVEEPSSVNPGGVL